MKADGKCLSRFAGLLLCLGVAFGAQASKVDCDKPEHETEKMVCGDIQLKMLDEMMVRVYEDLRGKLTGDDVMRLEMEQGQWVNQRNGFMCPDIYTCLSTYNQRMIELRRMSDSITSLKPDQRGMLKRVDGLLMDMEDSWEIGLESEITELPDRGLRGLYLRSKMGPEQLQQWLGLSPYTSGPHTAKEYIFSSKSSFGHYNPKFIELMNDWVKFFTSNPLAVPLTQGFYDNQLLDIVPAYYRMYEYLNDPKNKAWVDGVYAKYQKAIKEQKGLFQDGYYYPFFEFLEVAQKLEQDEGFNVYELATAGPFWLRRRMDGSEQQFAAMAKLLLDKFENLADAPL